MDRMYNDGRTVLATLLGVAAGALALQLAVAAHAKASARPDYALLRAGAVVTGDAALDVRRVSELLVEAVIQVESSGDPRKIGQAGERGIMQIKRATWKQVTRSLFGKPAPFDHAFNPTLNRRVGKAYLAELQVFLQEHRAAWRSDERSLLLACYNAGPARVRESGFDISRLPSSTQSYVERATALHEYYLADDAQKVRDLLLVENRIPAADAAGT